MHRVVPELIIENYRLGRFSGEFHAVTLFLDLSGFSTMTDVLMQHGQHGAEVLAGLMHSVFDPLVENIFAYNGQIVSFAGDGITALFQIESSQRSTALTALTAAWEIQQRLGEHPEHQTVYGNFRFSVKIGLAIGTVAWGILRSQDEQNATYYFRGTPVDVSAEAEHHALAGEILITDEINNLLKDTIQTQPFGPFHKLSGFRVELPVAAPAVFQPIDVGVARVFMPEKIIVQDVRGEFRQIVNLFMRFPDLPNEKLFEFFHIVFELHQKYGGLLNRLDFGDKGCNMLMLWGAPVAYENDIGRALDFILDLQTRVDFPVTAGVTYYIAHAGYLGSIMCEDYTCYGWGINLASRFMMSALPGQVWIDDRITRRVATRFDIETIGEQRFKGFSSEQRVNLLKGHKPEAGLIYQGERVGREKELTFLEYFVEPLWKGNFAGILLIVGEAGIGKGRLVHEFQVSALFGKNKALWALCQSDQILRQSLNPFRSWLRHYFGLSAAKSLDEQKEIFASKLQELITESSDPSLGQELSRLYPFLGALVDLHWADSTYDQLDAVGRYNNTLLALIALIKAESLRQPLTLWLEDMQFIDADTLNFLPRLKRSILSSPVHYPIAIIATSRPYGIKSIPEGLVDALIDLKGLTLEEAARLTEILLGGVPAVELVKLVMERSEGNPYFVEQIIRYLQEGNFIEMSERGWKQVKQTRDFFLPSDLSVLLVARLDQLNQEVKEMVQTASVLGREFALPVLVEMSGEADRVKRIVAEAQQSEIWATPDENRYIFAHGLLRDAAYAMQMRARQQELHRIAVDALEKIYADELKYHYEELAYHAEGAELPQKTQYYYSLAGKAAADLYQNSQAIDYFTRALAFTALDDLRTQFALLVERVGLFNRVGHRTTQSNDLDALENLALQVGDKQLLAKAKMLRAQYLFTVGDYPSTKELSHQVVAMLQEMGDLDVALGVYPVWAHALLRTGNPDEAMQRAFDGLQLAREAGRLVEEGRALNSIGLIALESRDPGLAQSYLEAALAIARATKEHILEARALQNLANSAAYVQRDYPAARTYYEQVYALVIEHGDRYGEALSLGNLGWVCGMLGDFVAAWQYNEQALIVSREVGNSNQEALSLMNLSAVAEIQGKAGEALQYANQANELCRQKADRPTEAWSYLYLGYAHLLAGQVHQARSDFEQAWSIRRELGQSILATEAMAGLIQVGRRMNDIPFALQLTEQLMHHFSNDEVLDGTEEPLRVYFACYTMLAEIGDSRAAGILQKAMQLLQAQVSKFSVEESSRMYIENFPWRRAIEQIWLAKQEQAKEYRR